jgi:chromosomal replication initiator protein
MTTFQDWIDLPESHAALEAVDQVLNRVAAGRTVRTTNPLVLHGPSGSGKSHLAATLAAELVRRRPESVVAVIPACDFLPHERAESHPAVATPGEELAADLVILEDVHHLAIAAVEALVRLLDFRQARGRQTVVTANQGPGHLRRLSTRLTSRLGSGLVIGLLPLSRDGRHEFLKQIAVRRRVSILPEVLEWLAANLIGSARQLVGTVTRLQALARLDGQLATLEQVQALFSEESDCSRGTLERIRQCVGQYFELDPARLQKPDRSRPVLLPRQVGMYLARRLTTMSLKQIGAGFGGRDHSTVLHACRRVERALYGDARLSSLVRELQTALV